MAIAFRCSQCDSLVQAPDEVAGQHLPCPRCQQPLFVPDPVDESPHSENAANAQVPPALSAALMISSIGFFCGLLSLFCCSGYYAGPFGIVACVIGLVLTFKQKRRFRDSEIHPPSPLSDDRAAEDAVPPDHDRATDDLSRGDAPGDSGPLPEATRQKTQKRIRIMLMLSLIAAWIGLATSFLGIIVSVAWIVLQIVLST